MTDMNDKPEAVQARTPPPFSAQGYLPSAYRRPEYVDYLEKAALAMKTIRLVVYAGLASFVVLAVYGFYLIYQLTNDVHRAVDQTQLMTQQMQAMTRIMTNMDASVARMDTNVGNMGVSINQMNGQLTQLGNTVALMQHSASNLDKSIGPVMGTMNRVMPFNWMGNNYNGSPPYAPPMQVPAR